MNVNRRENPASDANDEHCAMTESPPNPTEKADRAKANLVPSSEDNEQPDVNSSTDDIIAAASADIDGNARVIVLTSTEKNTTKPQTRRTPTVADETASVKSSAIPVVVFSCALTTMHSVVSLQRRMNGSIISVTAAHETSWIT